MQMSSTRPRLGRSIGIRLQSATAVAVLAVAGLLSGVYVFESSQIQHGRVELLQGITQSAAGIATEFEQAERAGLMSRDEAQQAAARAIGAIRYRGGEYVWINDVQPKMIMHPIKPALNGQDLTSTTDANGKHLFVVMADTVKRDGSGVVDYLWPRPGSEQPVPKLSFVQGFKPWGWVLGTGVYVDDLVQARQKLALTLAGLGTAMTMLVGLSIWLLARSVTRPLAALNAATERLSMGDLEIEVAGGERRDELGALARALKVLQANSHERVRLEVAADLERTAKDRRQGAMDRYTKEFGETISAVLSRLTGAARTMRDTAEEMAKATDSTRNSAIETAQGSAESSRDLATVASATVELSSSVDEIARQVAHSTVATQAAVDRAQQTNTTFETMSVMAGRIQDVGRVIAGIAAQTNLLALNATIEAARAGEAGKGFAVVATEVKALARQTAQATAEISEKVNAIRVATHQTATAIREVGTAIEEVDMVSAAIAAAVEQQGATTREISLRVQAVASSGEQTASAMAEVATISDRSGTMSRTVLSASSDIGDAAETLRIEVDNFLHTMTQGDDDRRHYERVVVGPIDLNLITDTGSTVTACMTDISCGGAALITNWQASAGVQLQVMMPGSREGLGARVVRCIDRGLAISFAQDLATQARVDAVVEQLTGRGTPYLHPIATGKTLSVVAA